VAVGTRVRAKELERGWRLIESQHPAGDGLVAEKLDFEHPRGDLMVGVDVAEMRHLLIPLERGQEVAERIIGKCVRLARRDLLVEGQTCAFIDLSCHRPDLYDEFAVLSGEIVDALADQPGDPVPVVLSVITDWRELLRAEARGGLSRDEIIGLYAELSLLEQLVHLDLRRRTDCWTGPAGGRHDFQRGGTVVEVKGTTSRRGRPVVVHGLDQLEPPPDALLYLLWIRLEVGIDRGDALADLVERVAGAVGDPDDFRARLRNVGYGVDPDADYRTPLFTVLESRLYAVDDRFPRITHASFIGGDLPRGVGALAYEIDLAGDDPVPLDEHATRKVYEAIACR
jgi:hypothetical protein